MLSASFVARLSTSPRGWPSKYFSGSRDSFASTCSRSRYTARCTMVVVSRNCRMPRPAASR